MCFKCFLLSYLERNKIVKIPQEKEQTDLLFICQEFTNSLSFERNVGLCLSFQRYDDEWEAIVEIDEGEEINTEKIRAVVMPILTTPADSNDKDVKMHKLTEGYHDESVKVELPVMHKK